MGGGDPPPNAPSAVQIGRGLRWKRRPEEPGPTAIRSQSQGLHHPRGDAFNSNHGNWLFPRSLCLSPATTPQPTLSQGLPLPSSQSRTCLSCLTSLLGNIPHGSLLPLLRTPRALGLHNTASLLSSCPLGSSLSAPCQLQLFHVTFLLPGISSLSPLRLRHVLSSVC